MSAAPQSERDQDTTKKNSKSKEDLRKALMTSSKNVTLKAPALTKLAIPEITTGMLTMIMMLSAIVTVSVEETS